MKTIHLKVPRYICSYFEKKFGKPCKFESHGVMCSYMRILLQDAGRMHGDTEWEGRGWLQGDVVENGVCYSWLEITLPSMGKEAAAMTYIAPRGRRSMARLLRDIVSKHVWCELEPIITENANVADVVAGWCEVNGIGMDDENSIRQMYYRQREYLRKKGINLMKNTKSSKKM